MLSEHNRVCTPYTDEFSETRAAQGLPAQDVIAANLAHWRAIEAAANETRRQLAERGHRFVRWAVEARRAEVARGIACAQATHARRLGPGCSTRSPGRLIGAETHGLGDSSHG